MSKEGYKRGRETAAPLPSLRDYWDNPAGFPPTPLAEPSRRNTSRPQITTPSLWDTNTVQSLADRQLSVGQVHEPTATLSRPLEGVIVTENRHQLADRLALYGVSSLSNAELLSLILRTSAGNERRVERVQELLAQLGCKNCCNWTLEPSVSSTD